MLEKLVTFLPFLFHGKVQGILLVVLFKGIVELCCWDSITASISLLVIDLFRDGFYSLGSIIIGQMDIGNFPFLLNFPGSLNTGFQSVLP
jgi:hypothetical protein